MGKFTGLVGVVELLIFWTFGTGVGGGVLLPPPPQPLIAIAAITPKTKIPNLPIQTPRVISFAPSFNLGICCAQNFAMCCLVPALSGTAANSIAGVHLG